MADWQVLYYAVLMFLTAFTVQQNGAGQPTEYTYGILYLYVSLLTLTCTENTVHAGWQSEVRVQESKINTVPTIRIQETTLQCRYITRTIRTCIISSAILNVLLNFYL